MDICHLAVRHANRRQGRSSLAHVKYLTRAVAATQRREGVPRVDVEHRNMPPWAQENPRAFWAAADTYERANGRLYTGLDITLPRELSRPEQVALAHAFIDRVIGTAHPCSWAVRVRRALDGGESPQGDRILSCSGEHREQVVFVQTT
jgi:hypothetical protein